ncbi:MAG: hypothetical protein IT290_04500 [Deltaproteobacteria bacterium]|nr:hypothetical protein [Deltaproteobacteria bacterium]
MHRSGTIAMLSDTNKNTPVLLLPAATTSVPDKAAESSVNEGEARNDDVVFLLKELLESQERGSDTQSKLFHELRKAAESFAPRSEETVASLRREIELVGGAMEERVNALRDDMRQTFSLLSPSIDRVLEQGGNNSVSRVSERIDRVASEFREQIEILRKDFERIGEQITGWKSETDARNAWGEDAQRTIEALRTELSIVRENTVSQSEFQKELEKDLQSLLVSSQDVVDTVTTARAEDAEDASDMARFNRKRAAHESAFFGAVILLLLLNAAMSLYILGAR